MTQLHNLFIGPGANTCLKHWRPYPCSVCHEQRQQWVAELKATWEAMHMSWNASASSVVARDAVNTLRASFAATYPTPTEEVTEQFAAAIRAVEGALTVVQPNLDGLVTISVSGHANPGHQKAAGWANDSFTVSIYQV